MIRISLPYLYNLAETLEPLERLQPDTRYGDVFFSLWSAQQQLQGLFTGSVFSDTLRSSRAAAGTLVDAIQSQLNKEEGLDRILKMEDVVPITYAFSNFKTALLAEIGTFPSYFVSQKGMFDTLTLLELPHKMFPAALPRKVPEAMFDVAEAGKALCYELGTACGFHVFRATETVLRRYYTAVTNGRPQPKVRNIAVYVNAMHQRKCGDRKILSVLDQMSKLHRNPLIHPDVALTVDEAISIVGMAHSAINAMLGALPEPPTTTTSVQAIS